MGDKTLFERVLDLELAVLNLEKFAIFTGEKIKVYDKYVIIKKKRHKALEKARRQKVAYREKKLAEGFREAEGTKKKAKYERDI